MQVSSARLLRPRPAKLKLTLPARVSRLYRPGDPRIPLVHRAEDFESAFVALSFCLEISPPQKLSDRFRVRRAPRAPPPCPPRFRREREQKADRIVGSCSE